MNLYVMRHGLAEPLGAASPEEEWARQLTKKGQRRVRKAARGLKALDGEIDVVLHSPWIRAAASAEIVAKTLGSSVTIQPTDALIPDRPLAQVVDVLAALDAPRGVVVVGHEPQLGALVSTLITGLPYARLRLKKAGIAKLSTAKLRKGKCAVLQMLMTARQAARQA